MQKRWNLRLHSGVGETRNMSSRHRRRHQSDSRESSDSTRSTRKHRRDAFHRVGGIRQLADGTIESELIFPRSSIVIATDEIDAPLSQLTDNGSLLRVGMMRVMRIWYESQVSQRQGAIGKLAGSDYSMRYLLDGILSESLTTTHSSKLFGLLSLLDLPELNESIIYREMMVRGTLAPPVAWKYIATGAMPAYQRPATSDDILNQKSSSELSESTNPLSTEQLDTQVTQEQTRVYAQWIESLRQRATKALLEVSSLRQQPREQLNPDAVDNLLSSTIDGIRLPVILREDHLLVLLGSLLRFGFGLIPTDDDQKKLAAFSNLSLGKSGLDFKTPIRLLPESLNRLLKESFSSYLDVARRRTAGSGHHRHHTRSSHRRDSHSHFPRLVLRPSSTSGSRSSPRRRRSGGRTTFFQDDNSDHEP